MQTTSGTTLLFIACHKGHQAVARLLLDRGADVNQARVRCGGGERTCGVWVVCVMMRAVVQASGAMMVWVGRRVYSLCGAWGVREAVGMLGVMVCRVCVVRQQM